MPGGDRTGPMGQGPMTGRAAGYCTGSAAAGYASTPGGGRGRGGFGGGRGRRGRRNQWNATGLTGWQRAAAGMPAFGGVQGAAVAQAETAAPTVASPAESGQQELDLLNQQAQTMEQQLKQLRERIEQFEAAN